MKPPPADLTRGFIVVSGNIGVGKSTLVRRLANAIGVPGVLESHEDNGFLVPFYDDPSRWAFHAQAGFLSLSIRDYESIEYGGRRGVLERTLEEHHRVFGEELRSQGQLSAGEFELLDRLHASAAERIPVRPEILVYLSAPPEVLDRRVRARGREGESRVTLRYLTSLNERYDAFVEAWKDCPTVRVDTTAIDIREDSGLQTVIDRCVSTLARSGGDE